MRRLWAALLGSIGFAIVGSTAWFVFAGTKHPSAGKSIAIALLSAVGVPIAFSLIVTAYRKFRGPNIEELKTEAEAKRRAAEALEKAADAEKVKAELEAYISIRAWRLEIERKRQDLMTAADALVRMLRELNASEARLGAEITQVNPATIEGLESLLEARPRLKIPSFAIGLFPLGIGRVAVQAGEWFANDLLERLDRRRMSRLQAMVPAAQSGGEQPEGSEALPNRGISQF